MSPTQFVDASYQHAGITPTTAEQQAALDEFNTPTGARGRVMRRVAENQTLYTLEFNRAFVLMQYFGYLRRNPDDSPDNNVSGYKLLAWESKLSTLYFQHLQNRPIEICVHAAHTVQCLICVSLRDVCGTVCQLTSPRD